MSRADWAVWFFMLLVWAVVVPIDRAIRMKRWAMGQPIETTHVMVSTTGVIACADCGKPFEPGHRCDVVLM